MHPRGRGFALALILISTSGLFALGMHGAVSTRAGLLEARGLLELRESQRHAQLAAALALQSLAPGTSSFAPSIANVGSEEAIAPGSISPDDQLELPPIIRELLGEMAGEIQEGARRSRVQAANAAPRRPGAWSAPPIPSTPLRISLPGIEHQFHVTIRDAAGQLNVNQSTPEQFERFLIAHGVDTIRARSIAHELHDWIDDDEFVRERGAEKLAHERRGVTCANRPMATLRELLYLPSMTPEIFHRIEHDLSIEGDARLHLATASREALSTLPGFSSDLVARLLERRDRGPISEEELDRLLPIAARDSRDRVRLESSPVLRLHVEIQTSARGAHVFQGLAVLGREGVRTIQLSGARRPAPSRTDATSVEAHP